jgi:ribosome-binding protein aMBF1 (putative translation factor)
MNVVLPKPIKESKNTITLSRSDWDALIDSIEDAEDLATVNARRAREAAVGKDAARRDYLTGDEIGRLLDWENPVRIWREKRGLSQRALASQAGVSASYLAEIETGRKPRSAGACTARSGVCFASSHGVSGQREPPANRLQSVEGPG